MKTFLIVLTLTFVSALYAGRIDWNSDTNLSTSWTGASVYTYALTTATADSAVTAFINGWSEGYIAEGKNYGGIQSGITFGSSAINSFNDAGIGTSGSSYFVVIVKLTDGTYQYSFAKNATIKDEGAPAIGVSVGFDDTGCIYDDNTMIADGAGWVKFNPSAVPEPTVLALLALGVAGLVLKRKVA